MKVMQCKSEDKNINLDSCHKEDLFFSRTFGFYLFFFFI